MTNTNCRNSCINTIKRIVSVLMLLAIMQSARAADGTWTGATNNNWQNTGNWSGGSIPANLFTGTFGLTGSGVISVGTGLTIKGIQFGVQGSNANAFTIGTGSETFTLNTAGNITVHGGVKSDEAIGAAGGTINLGTAGGGFHFVNNGTGTLTIADNLVSNLSTGSSSVNLWGAGNGVISGAMNSIGTVGTGGLVVNKYGSGTWTLTGANLSTGLITALNGKLIFDYATNTPISATAPILLNGGEVAFKGKSSGITTAAIQTVSFSSSSSWNYAANKLILDANGGGGVQLSINSLGGGQLSGGTPVTSNLFDLSSSSNNSITATIDSTMGIGSNNILTNNNGTNARALYIVRDSAGYGFATLSAASGGTIGRLKVSDVTSLTLVATGASTNFGLSGAAGGTSLTHDTVDLNYYTLTLDASDGDITLDMGTRNLGGTTGGRGLLVTGGHDVNITGSGTFTTSNNLFNYGTGTLNFEQNLAGSVMFAGPGFTNYKGAIGTATLAAVGGIVRISNAQDLSTLPGKLVVSSGAVLEVGADLNGAADQDFSTAIGIGNGKIQFFGDSGLSASAGADNVTKRVVNFGGSGAQLTWGAGGFLVAAGSSSPIIDVNATFLLSSAKSDATIEVQNAIALGAGHDRVVSVANGSAAVDAILSGVISDSGTGSNSSTLIKTGAGTLVLTATNSYNGGTMVREGKLAVTSSGALANTANVAVSSGAELNVDGAVNSNSTTIVEGVLSGSGSLGKVTLASGGMLSPGNSPGTLTTGDLAVFGGSILKLELNTAGAGLAGTNWDSVMSQDLDISNLSASSTFILKLTTLDPSDVAGLLLDWDPNVDHTWTSIMTFTSLNGTFDSNLFSFDLSDFQNSLNGTFQVIRNGNELDLIYNAVPEPGISFMLIGGLGLLFTMWKNRHRIGKVA